MKIYHSSPFTKTVNVFNLTLSGASHADKSLLLFARNLSVLLNLF